MLTQLLTPWHPRRRSTLALVALLLLTTFLTITPTQGAPPAPSALDSSINWVDKPAVLSNTGDVGYPWAAVDSNNITHAVYMTDNGNIWYVNTATRISIRLDQGGATAPGWPFAAIAVGPGGVIHVVYLLFNKDNQIYYQRSNDGGRTWVARSREQISGGSKAASPHIAVDSSNNAHIVWIDTGCDGQYNVRYRLRLNSGIKSGIESVKRECGTYQTRPQVTVIGTTPHVVFQRGDEIYYRQRSVNGVWTGDNLSKSNRVFSGNASIASDGISKLFVTWDEGVNNHDIKFSTSFDGGLNWSNTVSYASTDDIATNPHVAWSDTSKRAYVVWQDDNASDDGKSEIWEREFDPKTLDTTFADRVSHFNGRSQWPTIGVGPGLVDIVWMDEEGEDKGFFKVWDWPGTYKGVIGPPTGCDGTLVLNNGLSSTQSITLTGTITPEAGCVPDQMQVALNAPITDATPKIAYSASLPQLQAQAGLCIQTVSVRLFRNGAGGAVFNDTIAVDTSVDATVQVSNPHRNDLPAFPGPSVPGASDGDPNYTREAKFFLSINDAGDCTGLDTFVIPAIGSGTITNGSYTGWFDLPNITTAGSKQFIITLTDKAGHSDTIEQSIVYDPNPPDLVSTANPTVTTPLSTTSILVPLAFDGIDVTDDEYGSREGLPANAEFWGVLVANSTTNVTSDNPGLKWFPVQVPNASSTFTITWDLLTGLSNRPAQNTGGNIYSYIRFIDGAGNPTTDAIRVRRIKLEPNYTLPTLYLPFVGK
jgi:hypothetical protein